MAARHYQELTVWQKAMDLAVLSEVIERSSEVGRLINGLIESLNRQDEI